jgi:hypothetical protein
MERALAWIEADEFHADDRAVEAGLCVNGPWVAINLRVFSDFVARPRVELDTLLRDIGYARLISKTKAQPALQVMLPEIGLDAKHWSIRHAAGDGCICLRGRVESHAMPEISDAELRLSPGIGSPRGRRRVVADESYWTTKPAVDDSEGSMSESLAGVD